MDDAGAAQSDLYELSRPCRTRSRFKFHGASIGALRPSPENRSHESVVSTSVPAKVAQDYLKTEPPHARAEQVHETACKIERRDEKARTGGSGQTDASYHSRQPMRHPRDRSHWPCPILSMRRDEHCPKHGPRMPRSIVSHWLFELRFLMDTPHSKCDARRCSSTASSDFIIHGPAHGHHW